MANVEIDGLSLIHITICGPRSVVLGGDSSEARHLKDLTQESDVDAKPFCKSSSCSRKTNWA